MSRAMLHFHVGRTDEARDLVEAHHYSGRWPGSVQCVGTWHSDGGLFGDAGSVVAACVFSIPPTRWSEAVLELSRLCRSPACHLPLSGIIARTVQWVRKKQMADLLVSFADKTQNHHGGIYQASSWVYGGCRKQSMDGLIVDGEFVAGRSANSRWGTRSPTRLKERLGDYHEIIQHYDLGKHLYWRPLNKQGKRQAKRLGLQSAPYPKPEMAARRNASLPALSEMEP